MRVIVILLGTALVTFSLALRAEWQWNGASAEDYEEEDQASEAIWSDEDCESISEAAGLYLYLSGDVVERSDEADEQKKKAALFKAGVALSRPTHFRRVAPCRRALVAGRRCTQIVGAPVHPRSATPALHAPTTSGLAAHTV